MGRAVVLDLGWFRETRIEQFWGDDGDGLFVRVRSRTQRDLLRETLRRDPVKFGVALPLTLLEALVVNEDIVVDATALRLVDGQIPPALKPVIRLRSPPPKAYEEAERQSRRLLAELTGSEAPLAGRPQALSQLLAAMEDPTSENVFWTPEDKAWHDGIFKSTWGGFANSNDTLPRVIFYLELASALGDVLLLSPRKRSWFQILGRCVEKSVHEWLAEQVTDEVVGDVRKALSSLTPRTDPPVPPVMEMILKLAAEKGMPLSEAALELRASNNAGDYRRYLAALQDAIYSRSLGGDLEAKALLAPVQEAAKRWASEGAPSWGISHKTKDISLEALPLVGSTFKLGGLGRVGVRDALLTRPPGHLAFVASWFQRP